MPPTELKKEWLAKWRRILDDNASRIDNPEAHRMMCRWETRDMLEAGVIDEMEKFEMDELADAAYWHAVEELLGGHFVTHGPQSGRETSFAASPVTGTERDRLWGELNHGALG